MFGRNPKKNAVPSITVPAVNAAKAPTSTALTPEDIVNKRFQPTKFREGYDQDEIDDFLDEIVVAFRSLIAHNDQLKADLDQEKALHPRQIQ